MATPLALRSREDGRAEEKRSLAITTSHVSTTMESSGKRCSDSTLVRLRHPPFHHDLVRSGLIIAASDTVGQASYLCLLPLHLRDRGTFSPPVSGQQFRDSRQLREATTHPRTRTRGETAARAKVLARSAPAAHFQPLPRRRRQG